MAVKNEVIPSWTGLFSDEQMGASAQRLRIWHESIANRLFKHRFNIFY